MNIIQQNSYHSLLDLLFEPKRKYTSATTKPMRLPPPVFSSINYTKRAPIMSEDAYKEAIIAQARKDAEGGWDNFLKSSKYMELKSSYVSVVSPDRKGIIARASRTTQIPSYSNVRYARFFDSYGTEIANYDQANGWTMGITPQEGARGLAFDELYTAAFKVVMQAKDKSDIRTLNTFA